MFSSLCPACSLTVIDAAVAGLDPSALIEAWHLQDVKFSLRCLCQTHCQPLSTQVPDARSSAHSHLSFMGLASQATRQETWILHIHKGLCHVLQVNVDGLRRDAAVVVRPMPRYLHVTLLPPPGRPGVLHQPAVLPLGCGAVAAHDDCMVQLVQLLMTPGVAGPSTPRCS